jgi:tetratricopeptide (TPR) repeat protein
VVIISGRENEFLLNDIKEITMKLEDNYESILKTWNGEEQVAMEIEEILNTLITSGKYDGIYYGKKYPKARRNLLFENISLGLIRQAQKIPILLCLENLQWADPSTLALMHYVARNTNDSKLFIVGTYRPEDVVAMDGKEHPLITTLQLMDREGLLESIELSRLPEEVMREFIESMLSDNDLDNEFRNRIYKETEGNPFFIISLIRMLIEAKVIDKENDIWVLKKDLEEAYIPSGIYNVISRRLNRVIEEGREVLDYSAVIGEEFNPEILSLATQLDKIELLQMLRKLEQQHKLIRPIDSKYKFDHSKIKDVLYETIPSELRKEYHATIAKAIETKYAGESDNVIEDLAFHYYKCRKGEKALNYLLKAAQKAKMAFSNEETIMFYSNALEFIEDVNERTSILGEIGHTCDIIGNYRRSLEAYNEAIELATDDNKKALLMSKIASTHGYMGEFDKGITICKDALVLVGERGSMEEGAILGTIGTLHERKCENETALDFLKKSLEIYEKLDDKRAVANCLNTIGFSVHWLGRFEASIDYLKRALQIWKELEDLEGILQCNLLIGTSYSRLGELDIAYEYLKKALESSERVGDQKARIRCLGEIGLVNLERAEYEEAYEVYTICSKIAEKTGDKWAIAASYSTLCLIDDWTGNFEKALANLDEPHAVAEAMDYKRGIALNYVIYGECYIHKGDLEKAQSYCDKALTLFREYVVNELSWGLRLQAKIYQAQEKWTESIKVFNETIDFCIRHNIMGGELGRGYYDFAMMWKVKGDLKEARENLLKARKIYSDYKAPKKVSEIDSMLKALPN